MMENTIFEISDEEREEIEKLYRIIHSNKIKLPESENPLSKILEKENFIVTDHILMFVQNMTKSLVFFSSLNFYFLEYRLYANKS